MVAIGNRRIVIGSRTLVMRATNVSDAPCIVESYPDVAFADQYSNALDVGVDHGGAMLSDDPGATRIEVQPGASVVSTLAWSAMSAQGLDAAGWLHVDHQTVQIDSDITASSVTVTAWALPAE